MTNMHCERLRFASCYVYSPGGEDPGSRRSRLLCALLKSGDPRFIGLYAARVRQQLSEAPPLRGYVDRQAYLIPVPCSAPGRDGERSIPRQLARALQRQGVGAAVWPALRRASAVHRSSRSAPGSRPTVDTHYDSFEIDQPDAAPGQIVLIDDVVSRGRTLLAAALRLRQWFPATDIRAFAFLRTMSFAAGVERFLAPCVGEICLRGGEAWRDP